MKKKIQDAGWIYVLDNGMGHYKIGKTIHPTLRIKQLSIQLPFPVTIAYIFRDENHHEAEKALHALFAPKRLNGEWFELDPIDDIGRIQELADWSGWYEVDGGFRPDPFQTFLRPTYEKAFFEEEDHLLLGIRLGEDCEYLESLANERQEMDDAEQAEREAMYNVA